MRGRFQYMSQIANPSNHTFLNQQHWQWYFFEPLPLTSASIQFWSIHSWVLEKNTRTSYRIFLRDGTPQTDTETLPNRPGIVGSMPSWRRLVHRVPQGLCNSWRLQSEKCRHRRAMSTAGQLFYRIIEQLSDRLNYRLNHPVYVKLSFWHCTKYGPDIHLENRKKRICFWPVP